MKDLSLVSALSEDARLSHLIAEGIPNMVWTAAPDGSLEFLNSRVFEYTGMDAQALRGWGWQAVIHVDDWERCERTWRRSLAEGEPYRTEYRIRRGADGAYRWHLGAALPLRDPEGRVTKWFGTCTDIEDQKRAAELIRTRQASLEALADERLRQARERERELNEAQRLARIGSWEWEVATQETRWSAEMFRIFGLDPARGAPDTGRHPDLYTEESWARVRAAGLHALATGEGYELELEARLPCGGTRWTLSRAECVCDAGGKVVRLRGTVQDITERRTTQHGLQRYSDQVRALLHRLVEAQEAERRRLATALHDLIGQNLTALNLGLDILRTDLHASANSLIGARIGSMTRTVGETVDAIRGVMAELHPTVLDDYGLVPALHAHAERFRELTGIRVGIEAPPDLPRLARSAELAMFRIVQEALTNVAKHSGATRAAVRIAREDARFSLLIEDDGRGFAEREGARASARGGWGLPAMRERAEALGGKLLIRFPASGGTRVLVELEVPGAD